MEEQKIIIFKIEQLKNALKFIEASLETLEKLQTIIMEDTRVLEVVDFEATETK
jgi:uncharacterized protein (DUF362 family)